MKRCSTSLVMKEMHIKITMKYCYRSIIMVKIKKSEVLKVGKDVVPSKETNKSKSEYFLKYP